MYTSSLFYQNLITYIVCKHAKALHTVYIRYDTVCVAYTQDHVYSVIQMTIYSHTHS